MTRAPVVCRTFCLGLLLLLSSCGGSGGEPDLFEIIPVDVVRFGPGDAVVDLPGIPPDASVGDLPAEVADLSLPDVPEPVDVPVAPDLPEVAAEDVVEPPDLQLPDTGMVDAGPCGQCPGATPVCQNGTCVCTGDSCPGGFYCKGGKCTACLDDIHCGPQCESCASMGMYCKYDGSQCVSCDANHPCPPGNKCLGGECQSCEGLGLCGPDCIQCPPGAPLCVNGACECSGDSCGEGALCEGGECVPCTDNDPLHCGPTCLVCQEPNPHCGGGACTFCDKDDACGPTCAACGGETAHCHPDGSGCVPCLEDVDCPVDFKCKSFQCIADCKAQGCQTSLSPSGKKCSEAWVVGRVEAAGTFTKSGDTWNQSNDDDLNYFMEHSECWDASYDHFFRIYLMPGEKLAVTATPASGETDFDIMLKLYTGTECDDDSAGIFSANDKYLVQCWNDQSDGKGESFSYTVGSEGWYTVVVDGRLSGTDEGDYGAYTATLKLTCVEETCCCE